MKLSDKEKDKIIEDVIKAFGCYALGDIKYTAKKKPLAAFILCTCFIDQISGFVYCSTKNDRAERFITQFMPQYGGMNIYKSLRNKLVHNYSTEGYYRLSYDKPKKSKQVSQNLKLLNLHKFIQDIETAFGEVENELNKKSSIRNCAIHFDTKHFRVFRGSQYTVPFYSEDECKDLLKYYLPKLKGKRVKDNIKNFIFSDIKKKRTQKGYTLEVIADYNGFEYYYELNDAIEVFKLQPISKTLNL